MTDDALVPEVVEQDLLSRYRTDVGLELPADLPYEDWATLGYVLCSLERAVMWWIGDWWHYGEHRYGERAAQVLDQNRWSFQTFADAGWVAGRIETSVRTEVLSFSHHRQVAPLEPTEQKRWLDLTQRHSWTKEQLRRARCVHRASANTALPPETREWAVEALSGIEDGSVDPKEADLELRQRLNGPGKKKPGPKRSAEKVRADFEDALAALEGFAAGVAHMPLPNDLTAADTDSVSRAITAARKGLNQLSTRVTKAKEVTQ